MSRASAVMDEARGLISRVRGRQLSVEERVEQATKLAALILQEAQRIQTAEEREKQSQLAAMMEDASAKSFAMALTDQCFRSRDPRRVAGQIVALLRKYGTPGFLPLYKKLMIAGFDVLGRALARFFIPLIKQMVRQETAAVILPGEPQKLFAHIHRRRGEGVRVNLNHLGEAILGEIEADRRLNIYLSDLAHPDVEYISIKISTLFSQLNLLAWEETVSIVSERLKILYRAAQAHRYKLGDKEYPKFVNLDMEEYRDLHLTVEIFQTTLDDPEFKHYSAGIALQSYLPDSYAIQQKLTEWAMKRMAEGGAPISIRIVKGANLAMEQVEASLRGWPQAPYCSKHAVDSNYKRMLTYGCLPAHAKSVHIGVASHNLFDIAYGLLLRSEHQLDREVRFEMLEGMADHMRRVVQQLAGEVLLYCPAATENEFQNAVAYLIRRLDENTAPENFLRQAFSLKPGSGAWDYQADLFKKACEAIGSAQTTPNRQQNRLRPPQHLDRAAPFDNEPDTDLTLAPNRMWAHGILRVWSSNPHEPIPLMIDGQEISGERRENGISPSEPEKTLYTYTLATSQHVEEALRAAQKAEQWWGNTEVSSRINLLHTIAEELRKQRGILIGAMMADTGKTLQEADVEVSEAIDFAEYYARLMNEWNTLDDIVWKPKGTILVAPPWNFPVAIPSGCILAALVTGNCVIFKPAQEAVLVGWTVAQAFWRAGVSKEVLQFMSCEDDPVGSQLVTDARIAAVVLTGATETAKKLLKLRPGLDLIAETGGKNAIVISNMADRDLAIKDIIQSAFGHAGQKCSACSLAICHQEVYHDSHFREQLRDAAASLYVGIPWDPATRINPLIRPPSPTLLQGLTTLEDGEEWLLEPRQSPENPHLWSPGIKIGVKPSSFTYRNELFGPVLALMCAEDLDHAIQLVNGTNYGLTSGIHSLDEAEVQHWLQKVEAGNCYVNRGITGAIVQRQPFGGCKESCFGKGMKAGGPNYLTQFMVAEQRLFPLEEEIPSPAVVSISKAFAPYLASIEEEDLWTTSLSSYAFYFNHYFILDHDPARLLGQDNLLRYLPHHQMILRVQEHDSLLDAARVIAATITCGASLKISTSLKTVSAIGATASLQITEQDEKAFIAQLLPGQRIRFLSPPSPQVLEACANLACHVIATPVLANGRLELLNYLREVSISIDYHRYGNLGDREGEQRGKAAEKQQSSCCGRNPCCNL